MVCTWSVFPSTKTSDYIEQHVNATLAIHQLIENAHEVMCIDNEALYDICHNDFKITSPSYRDLNRIVSSAMSGVTCSLRFPSYLNSDLRKMAINLVPFPRLHFFLIGHAPIHSLDLTHHRTFTTIELAHQIFDKSNLMCSIDPLDGRYDAAYAIFRGNLTTYEAESCINALIDKGSQRFTEWMPDNIKTSTCKVPDARGSKISATLLSNSTAIRGMFQRIYEHLGDHITNSTILTS